MRPEKLHRTMTRTPSLTSAENLLVAAAARGETLDLRNKDTATGDVIPGDPRNDPANGATWDASRTISANVIYLLSVSPPGDWQVHPKGVRLQGARIDGPLDFEGAKLVHSIYLIDCFMGEIISLEDAEARTLYFAGSHVPGIAADRLIANGRVFLGAGFTSKGMVRFLGANIRGNFDCSGGAFENINDVALGADMLSANGNILLKKGFTAKGEVRLVGAKIGGVFDCIGAKFENPGGVALQADSIITRGSVFLSKGFAANGEVRLLNAQIGGALQCNDATFDNPGGEALVADGLVTQGAVILRKGFSAKGEVRFSGAKIGGQFGCVSARFCNPTAVALRLDGLVTGNSVFLDNEFCAEGQVRLVGASIGGDLSCVGGGKFENLNGVALHIDQALIKGSVYFRKGFVAKGGVQLIGANIGGNLECDGAVVENLGGIALNATNLVVKGDVLLRRQFTAKGTVRFNGANIGGDLSCEHACFSNKGNIAFTIERAAIRGSLFWKGIALLEGGADFMHARVGQLTDEKASWPTLGNLHLDGFEYDALAPHVTTDAKDRMEWLRLQYRSKGTFFPQPYEQLIRVLRRMGHEKEAREIAIAKMEDLRRSGTLGRWARFWNWLLGVTIGHGYKTGYAVGYMLVMIVIGTVVFATADQCHAIVPAKESIYLDERYTSDPTWLPDNYPSFQAIVYSADVFLPVVDLHQEEYWGPNENSDFGWFVRIYVWIHIGFGWILTTILVVGFTGIVRQD